MDFQLRNMLSTWGWFLLGLVPVVIVLLYFLKLRRQPLVVSSTYLWRKSIEDLHVNSLWQRLRKSLLLFLQLAAILLVAIALLRPTWRASALTQGRYIFLIDNSASMSATDVEPSRLEEAKRRASELIEQMENGDSGMIISFADNAKVEQDFTTNRDELLHELAGIQVTDRPTSIQEALQIASGLANPSRTGNKQDRDRVVAESKPAQLFIFSDGNLPPITDFSLGALQEELILIGAEQVHNVGIMQFNLGRSDSRSGQFTAFARIENFGSEDQEVSLELRFNGELIDADRIEVAKGDSAGMTFELAQMEEGLWELRIADEDDLAIDNAAWYVTAPPLPAKVLLVTEGNEFLRFALKTARAEDIAEVEEVRPDYLAKDECAAEFALGKHDLVIFDRCQPKELPACNTLFIGEIPPEGWTKEGKATLPRVLDVDREHPVMSLVELFETKIVQADLVTPPPGARTLVDGDGGPLMLIAPRDAWEDLVVAFSLIDNNEVNTSWTGTQSFPVFMFNVLEYLGGQQLSRQEGSVAPGKSIPWRGDIDQDTLEISTPRGESYEVARGSSNFFTIAMTNQVGVYEVQGKDGPLGKFAVNLFDSAESAIVPRTQPLRIGYEEVLGQRERQPIRREAWKFAVLVTLAVVCFEWYTYARRVLV